MPDKGIILGMSRQFMIENRAALVAAGVFTVDEIVQATTPNSATTRASVTADVNAQVTAINAAAAAKAV